MELTVEQILYLILFFLGLIIGLLTVMIFLLRKMQKNNYDWSLVYPELAGMDFEQPARSMSGELDKMLYESSPVKNGDPQKKNSISVEQMKIQYAEKLSGENVPVGEEVIGSIFAPETASPGEEIIVAAFVHLPSQKDEVEEAAKLIDDEIIKRVEKFLSLKVNKGDELLFKLRVDHAEIDDPIQKIIWNGRLESVEFGVTINDDIDKPSLLVKLEILVNSVPAGNMKFKLKIGNSVANAKHEVPETLEAHSYKKAFISYASPDRNEVLLRTQMLAATGISYFQDIMNLKPGELWENSLYKEIETADVFYLFWSNSAKNSEWVRKEYQFALDKFGANKKPEIIPVPIEGPPVAEPPKELSHLHFNDGFLYFLDKRNN